MNSTTKTAPTIAQLERLRDEVWNRPDSLGGLGACSTFSLEYALKIWEEQEARRAAGTALRERSMAKAADREAVRRATRGLGDQPETADEVWLRTVRGDLPRLRAKYLTARAAGDTVSAGYAWDSLQQSVAEIVRTEPGSEDLLVSISGGLIEVRSETRTITEVIPAWVTDSHLPDVCLHFHVWTIQALVLA